MKTSPTDKWITKQPKPPAHAEYTADINARIVAEQAGQPEPADAAAVIPVDPAGDDDDAPLAPGRGGRKAGK